jgi:hypothetical protein
VSNEESRLKACFNGSQVETVLSLATASIKLNGDIQAGSFTSASDGRLKTDIAEIANGLEIIDHLRPVEYNWVDGRPTINPGHKELGFIAQELEAVCPNVVKTEATEELADMKRVAYDRIVAVLVAAVKELKAEVDALKNK